jgi:hypothetical protein
LTVQRPRFERVLPRPALVSTLEARLAVTPTTTPWQAVQRSSPAPARPRGGAAAAATSTHKFSLLDTTVDWINAAFDAGTLTSEKLVSLYMPRIASHEQTGPIIDAFTNINPNPIAITRALDEESRAKEQRQSAPFHLDRPEGPLRLVRPADHPGSIGLKDVHLQRESSNGSARPALSSSGRH